MEKICVVFLHVFVLTLYVTFFYVMMINMFLREVLRMSGASCSIGG